MGSRKIICGVCRKRYFVGARLWPGFFFLLRWARGSVALRTVEEKFAGFGVLDAGVGSFDSFGFRLSSLKMTGFFWDAFSVEFGA